MHPDSEDMNPDSSWLRSHESDLLEAHEVLAICSCRLYLVHIGSWYVHVSPNTPMLHLQMPSTRPAIQSYLEVPYPLKV